MKRYEKEEKWKTEVSLDFLSFSFFLNVVLFFLLSSSKKEQKRRNEMKGKAMNKEKLNWSQPSQKKDQWLVYKWRN